MNIGDMTKKKVKIGSKTGYYINSVHIHSKNVN